MENVFALGIFTAMNFYFYELPTTDFGCHKVNKNYRICVPIHCDTSYNCPYPYSCNVCTKNCEREENHCKEDKGIHI